MIVKMKKITLLVSSERVTQALWELRKLGLVHVECIQKPQAHYITSAEHRIFNLDKVLSVLKRFKTKNKNLDSKNFAHCIKEVISLQEEREELAKKLEELEEKILGETFSIPLFSAFSLP